VMLLLVTLSATLEIFALEGIIKNSRKSLILMVGAHGLEPWTR
jgi:hypothetical protein